MLYESLAAAELLDHARPTNNHDWDVLQSSQRSGAPEELKVPDGCDIYERRVGMAVLTYPGMIS